VKALRTALLAAALLAALAPAAHATYPGANGKLVFLQNDVGSGEPYGLAVSDANGRGESRDPFGPRCGGVLGDDANLPCPHDPQWSPNGQLVAFAIGNFIHTIHPDGTDADRISFDGLSDIASPTWSPDGKQLAFSAISDQGAGKRQIYITRADGTGLRRITARGTSDLPAWSSRDEIAFVRSGNVWAVRGTAPRTKARRITSHGGTRPTWSPSGRSLAFTRRTRPTRRAKFKVSLLYRVSASGKRLKRLTRKVSLDPSWTPNGKRILFVRFGEAGRVIMSVDPAGRRSRVVVRGFEGRAFNVAEPDQQPVR
jgi:Tol biopolymer transport system component